MKYLKLIFVLALFPLSLHATHIVGGEMNYTCLGDNQYEITLTIFRDCYNGNPNAWFDDPASIGVFNSDNLLLQEILIPLMGNDTLDPVLSNECLVVPPDVCVHTTTYRAVVELPPLIGGYQLAYQRCCRNQTIVNIIDPLDSGATYGVTISERALLECNSNPKFSAWPPIYICANEPINFDQSAFDIDGDSIVYKLCTPLLGATPDIPQPQPPNNPPYQEINWVNPPYNVNNMLNGTGDGELLEIDAQTGLLTGVPNTVGQFVVGICVEEYRDGELISTTRRDFQYNVGICGQAVSSFFAPEIQCESLTVQFDNMSEGADDYLWAFNDPNNPGAFSSEPSPSYTYSDTGLFTIMLIAEPNSICSDTSYQDVYLQYNSLFPDFSYEFSDCSDSLTISVTDLTIDTISTPTDWQWELMPYGEISTDQNPTFVVGSSEQATLTLTVTAANGCEKTIEQTFPIELIEEELPADSVLICLGDSFALNPDFNASYSYQWSPADYLDDSDIPNPTTTPDATVTYSVTITDEAEFCQIEREITVVVPEVITVAAPADTTICDPLYTLYANTNTGVDFVWATDPNFNDVIATTDSVVVEPFGATTYYVLTKDEAGCEAVDSVQIIGNGINVDLSMPEVICEGDAVQLELVNNDPVDVLLYEWSPESFIVSGQGTATPTVQPDQAGTFTIYANLENELGCTLVDSTQIVVIDTNFQADFVSSIQCSGYTVQFTGLGSNAPFYRWFFGDPNDPTATGQGITTSHTYAGPGTYAIVVTLSELVPCPDTLVTQIVVEEPNINLDFDWAYSSCADTAVIQFNDLSTNTQSTIIDWTWMIGDSLISGEQNPSIVIDESQDLEVQLQITSNDGCVDTLSETITFDLIDIELADTLIACNGEAVSLNPGGNVNYVYNWSPAEGLDNPNNPNPMANPTVTTTYTVQVEDFNGDCSAEQMVTVVVPPAIALDIPQDTTICSSDFLLYANSVEAVSYEWSENPDYSMANPDPEFTITVEDSVSYYIRVRDAFGCTLEDSVTILSNGIDASIEGPATICVGDSAMITVIPAGDDMLTYDWSPTEGILSATDEAVITVSPESSTVYTVHLENQFGCELDLSTSLNIFNFIPPLEILADPDTLFGVGNVQLAATLDDGYLYDWAFSPSLSDLDIPNPVATPEQTTTYELRITDQNGCTNEAFITITVVNPGCDDPFIYVPNGFTPNGDGKNDVLYVRGNNIDEMLFLVYNRWGEEVFRTTNPGDGWDGRFKGRLLDPDVFGYYLEVKCFNGDEYFKKGNITLIR